MNRLTQRSSPIILPTMAAEKDFNHVLAQELQRVELENFAILVQFWQDALCSRGGRNTDWGRPLMQLLNFAVQHGFWGAGILDAAHYVEGRELQAAFEAYAPGVGHEVLSRLPRNAQGQLTSPFAHE